MFPAGQTEPLTARKSQCSTASQHGCSTTGEAIYETRPWKVYGEGPNSIKAGSFQGGSVSKLGEKDIRFTCNKSRTVIYALVLGWPTESFTLQSLGLSAATRPGKVAKLELLGRSEEHTSELQSLRHLVCRL